MAARPPKAAPKAASKAKVVLTVEDSPNLRRLVAYNLKRAHFKVYEAENGREAVKVLQKVVPDLILLDQRMPEMDGFTLLELLRQYPKAAAIPVIMLTALSQSQNVDRALALGVVDYLVKPLDPTLLIARVRAALAGEISNQPRKADGNRRVFARASIHGVGLGPRPGGTGVDIGEGGIAWRIEAPVPPAPGDVVVLEAPALFKILRLGPASLRCRVIYAKEVGRQQWYVGATFIGLTQGARDAIRRYVFERMSRSALRRG